jgi:putative transposase
MTGEIRDREKTMRGLKVNETPILTGYQLFHNYIRPHESLDGKTPADVCGITVEGQNKWLTLIQNAAQKTDFLNPKIEHYSKKQGYGLLLRYCFPL